MTDGKTDLSSMSAVTPTLIPRGGHFPALLPPVPSRGEPKPPTFRGRSDGRINTVRDLAREMDDLSDEEAEVEGLVSKLVKDSPQSSFTRDRCLHPFSRIMGLENEDFLGLSRLAGCSLTKKRKMMCVLDRSWSENFLMAIPQLDEEEDDDDDDDTGGDDDGTDETDEEAEDDAEADNESMRDLDASIEDLDEQTESISGEMGSMAELPDEEDEEEEISD